MEGPRPQGQMVKPPRMPCRRRFPVYLPARRCGRSRRHSRFSSARAPTASFSNSARDRLRSYFQSVPPLPPAGGEAGFAVEAAALQEALHRARGERAPRGGGRIAQPGHGKLRLRRQAGEDPLPFRLDPRGGAALPAGPHRAAPAKRRHPAADGRPTRSATPGRREAWPPPPPLAMASGEAGRLGRRRAPGHRALPFARRLATACKEIARTGLHLRAA